MSALEKCELTFDGTFAERSYGLYAVILTDKKSPNKRHVYFGKTGDNHPEYEPRAAIVRLGRHFGHDRSATDRQLASWLEEHNLVPSSFIITFRYVSIEALFENADKRNVVKIIEGALQAEFGNLDNGPDDAGLNEFLAIIADEHWEDVYNGIKEFLVKGLT